ncbi:hypothetical protein XENTR_v10019442 [Xenopus tropicalis]|nr:hypothetical protein XENTR_v10019442 [Xenopus tropicalis]
MADTRKADIRCHLSTCRLRRHMAGALNGGGMGEPACCCCFTTSHGTGYRDMFSVTLGTFIGLPQVLQPHRNKD